MSNTLSETVIQERQPHSISKVWLVPLFAAIIAGAVAWQTYASQGPLIAIQFNEATGLEAGKTQIRYRDVVVGQVQDVKLTDDSNSVIVSARLEKTIGEFVGDTTRFWVVRARFDGGNISGLGTILSGAYIKMDWSQKPSASKTHFVGLESPPLTPAGTPGRRIILTSDRAGSLNVGAPIYYLQLKAGQIDSRRLSDDGKTVIFEGFVNAPYHQFLNNNTRFWNASGIDISTGPEGLEVHIETLDALVSGGVVFQTIGGTEGATITQDGVEFSIYKHRRAAEQSQFRSADDEGLRLIALFDESIEGLNKEAPIKYKGIQIGQVSDVRYEFPRDIDTEERIYAILEIQPARLGLEDFSADEVRQAMDIYAKEGMRARLASSNFLTGAQHIELLISPGDTSTGLDMSAMPYPALPTVPSETLAISNNVQALLDKLSKLPLNELITSINTAVNDADKLLLDTDVLIANPAMRKLPDELATTLRALAKAATNIEKASTNMPSLIRNLDAISVSTRNDLPKLMRSLNQLAQQASTSVEGLSPDSALYNELVDTLREVEDAASAAEELAQRLDDTL